MTNNKLAKDYLQDIIRLLNYYKSLGEKAIHQVPEEKLKDSPSPQSNSIAVMVKHLHGNMMSRWTNFLNSDGEKDWRDRDGEFEDPPSDKESLMQLWNEGWQCLMNTIQSLSPEDLGQTVYIRNEGHLALEALQRQLAHYSYHIGQIVFLSRDLAGDQWKSLSIPKGQSKPFNKQKFSTAKERKHFTQ